jgi:hypothetical protein
MSPISNFWKFAAPHRFEEASSHVSCVCLGKELNSKRHSILLYIKTR